jgi:hypothetical protein
MTRQVRRIGGSEFKKIICTRWKVIPSELVPSLVLRRGFEEFPRSRLSLVVSGIQSPKCVILFHDHMAVAVTPVPLSNNWIRTASGPQVG